MKSSKQRGLVICESLSLEGGYTEVNKNKKRNEVYGIGPPSGL